MQDTNLDFSNLPAVSIIVPVYNAAETIAQCIDSLLVLNYPKDKHEIIVVNNRSDDNTLDLLLSYTPKISILNEQKRGAAAARNLGVFHAKHPIVAFTDADCVVDRDWLIQLLKPLQKISECVACGGRNLSFPHANRISTFGEAINDQGQALKERLPYLITMNMAVRKHTLLGLGCFDTHMIRAEDTDLSFRMLAENLQFSYAETALVYHNNPSSLAALFIKGYQHGHWNVKLIKKHQQAFFAINTRLDIYGGLRILQTVQSIVVNGLKEKQVPQSDLCQLVFDAGKKLGMLTGSARFRFFYL